MATFSYEGINVGSSSKISKEQKIGMNKSSGVSASNRKRSNGFRKSPGGLRMASVEPNSRTHSRKSDVSMRDSQVFVPRPLPPLLKSNQNNAYQRSREETPSYLPLVVPKHILPPIKQTNQRYLGRKQYNNGSDSHCQNTISQQQLMSKTILNEDVNDILHGEQFIPLRVSTLKNSKTMSRSTNRRALPKPINLTFRQSSGTDQQDGILPSSVTKSRSSSTSTYDSLSNIFQGGVTDKKELRRLSRIETRQWVKSSDFALKTQNDIVLSSLETSSFPTVSSITLGVGRYPNDRNKLTSTEKLRRISSNMKPPLLPFQIVVHERVAKFSVDLQFRVQHIKDWWSELRFPRLPKITIDIDFVRHREALRRLCARLRSSLRYPSPLILDPPPRFVIIPPSAWNLHDVSMITDERKRRKLQSLQQYNRKVGCYLQGDVAILHDDDRGERRSRCDFTAGKRRRNTGSGLHVSFVDEQEDGALKEIRRRRPSSSRQALTKNNRTPLPKFPTSMTENEHVSEKIFNSARKRLASVLKNLDDPSWYGAWIAKHDEMERDVKKLNQKRVDLIRALTFAMESEPCQRSTILGRVQADDNDHGATTRQMTRVHQHYAHHRLGMSHRQPSTTLGPAMHRGATAYGSHNVAYCSRSVQPMYTDERPGCLACRVMKAARRFGCEDRLSQLSTKPTIWDYYTSGGDARQN